MCRPFDEWPEILMADDCIKYLGLSSGEAYQLFNRPDFKRLLINPSASRYKRIGKHALYKYINKGCVDTE